MYNILSKQALLSLSIASFLVSLFGRATAVKRYWFPRAGQTFQELSGSFEFFFFCSFVPQTDGC